MLKQLNYEKKILFLKLAKQTMESNGYVSDVEKEMFSTFCTELNVEKTSYSDYNFQETAEQIIIALNEICTFSEKKMILFEMITMAFADKDIDYMENELLNTMVQIFNITAADEQQLRELSQDLVYIQQDILNAITK